MTVGSKNVHILEAVWKLVGPQGLNGRSPVMVALVAGDRDLTNALLSRGSDIKWFSEKGECALFLACFQGGAWLDVVEFLCRNLPPGTADLPPGRRQNGAVHWTCESGSLPNVKAVLGRPEVDVNRVDVSGHIGPYYAVDSMPEADFVELMRMFLDRGLDLNGDALSIVVRLSWAMQPVYSVMEFLFQKGLNPLADVPGTGKRVWRFFDTPDPQLRRLYQTYCAEALAVGRK
jgi:ankyrin repeat protein